jgi:hypothetical protein
MSGRYFEDFELHWPRPVRPGDELHLESEVLEVRLSASRPEQGLIKVRTTTLNQKGEAVQVQVVTLIVRRRPPPAQPGAATARAARCPERFPAWRGQARAAPPPPRHPRQETPRRSRNDRR